MPSKGLLWGLAYTAFSLASFAVSVSMLASRSYDFLTLMQELTVNFRLVILLNFIVFCFLAIGFLSIRVLFRQIRIIEIEHIADQLPFYGINLLFILFNDNNLLLNMVWTGLTVLVKVYHITACDRVDFLQVQVVNQMSLHQHTKWRVLASFALNGYVLFLAALLSADIVIARILAYDIFQGVSSMGSLLFGIQFSVMAIDCFAFLGKLGLNVYELVFYRCADSGEHDLDDEDDLDEQIWQNRAIYVQGFDIMTSVLKIFFYSVFLYTLYFHSRLALPIPLIQGCIVSIHLAVKQTLQFMNFLSQSRHVESQLVSPTEAELEAADHMCIICREDMHFPLTFSRSRGRPLNTRKHPKKLQCGHILHLCCLKDWLERSDRCPLCRKIVFSKNEPTSPNEDVIPNRPADPVPVGRPVAPDVAMTATEPPVPTAVPTGESSARVASSTLTPTPTTALTAGSDADMAVLDPQTGGTQYALLMSSLNPMASPATGESSSGLRSRASAHARSAKFLAFVPRDWALFLVTSTADPRSFRVNLSATQSALLRVRRDGVHD